MDFAAYLDKIRAVYQTGVASEHKGIDKDVKKPAGYRQEQKDRYRKALHKSYSPCSSYDPLVWKICSNLILTKARR